MSTERAQLPHRQPVGGPLADDAARADELLRLACLTYGHDDPSRRAQARALLAEHPRLATASIHTMAATGEAEAAEAVLRRDPSAASRPGGPFDWEPLLYLTYSRLDEGGPASSALDVARLLLTAGADPDVGFLWEGLVPPFTALTGSLGSGEGGQPRHASGLALARLLLEAGADANDGQALYNCGLGGQGSDDTDVLQLLFEFGLGQGDGGPWARALGDRLASPRQLVQEELQHAAARNLVRRARLLLDHGADPNGHGLHPVFGGRSAHQLAVGSGHREVADLLVQAGADVGAIDPLTALVGACLAGDEPAVEAQVAADPSLLPRALGEQPQLVVVAARSGRPAAVRIAVALGFDVNAQGRATALHEAALQGDAEVVRALLELGADPTVHDPVHDSTPHGWATFGGHPQVAALVATAP